MIWREEAKARKNKQEKKEKEAGTACCAPTGQKNKGKMAPPRRQGRAGTATAKTNAKARCPPSRQKASGRKRREKAASTKARKEPARRRRYNGKYKGRERAAQESGVPRRGEERAPGKEHGVFESWKLLGGADAGGECAGATAGNIHDAFVRGDLIESREEAPRLGEQIVGVIVVGFDDHIVDAEAIVAQGAQKVGEVLLLAQIGRAHV